MHGPHGRSALTGIFTVAMEVSANEFVWHPRHHDVISTLNTLKTQTQKQLCFLSPCFASFASSGQDVKNFRMSEKALQHGRNSRLKGANYKYQVGASTRAAMKRFGRTLATMTAFLRIFMAWNWAVRFSLTRMTLPKVPLPRTSRNSKSVSCCGRQGRVSLVYEKRFLFLFLSKSKDSSFFF